MTTCDDFEVAVEQRLHGALDPAGAAALAHHLSACAGCRSFETGAKEMEDAMKMDAVRVSGEVDWAELGRRLERWKRQLVAGNWWAVALFIVVTPMLLLSFGHLAGAITGGVTVLAWGWWATRRRIGEARAAGRSSQQLLLFLRGQLDDQIRTEKQNAVVLPFMVLLPLYGLLSREITRWSLLGTALVMLLFVALAVRSRFMVLPRLARQRAELG